MAKPHRANAGPSQRALRVGELVRHALAEALQRGDVPDPVLGAHVVTVPEVRMSPDLKLATCFVMPLGGKDGDKVVAALEKNRAQFRHALAPRLGLKFMPDLRFRLDTSFDEGARMDALLRSPEVVRDLDKEEE
ncbi:MAG TPA: 30S ribosome-binding factor RbfA [Hyphomicrobiales bacterium]|nr:30S ribosome-binding factor RbfA [Hyphomicrobiales bacterium]